MFRTSGQHRPSILCVGFTAVQRSRLSHVPFQRLSLHLSEARPIALGTSTPTTFGGSQRLWRRHTHVLLAQAEPRRVQERRTSNDAADKSVKRWTQTASAQQLELKLRPHVHARSADDEIIEESQKDGVKHNVQVGNRWQIRSSRQAGSRAANLHATNEHGSSRRTVIYQNGLLRVLTRTIREYVGALIVAAAVPKEPAQGQHASLYGEVAKMAERGYTIADVVAWFDVACSRTSDEAAQKLASLTDQCLSQARNLPPTFILGEILRASHLNITSLVKLVENARLRIPWEGPSSTPENKTWKIWDNKSAMLLVTRLLRHARQIHPSSIPDIAEVACAMLHDGKGSKTLSDPRIVSKLTYVHNHLLSLLSLPSQQGPFLHVPSMQQAQLHVLRSMLEFTPRLPVTREGYQALAIVQLAHKKSPDETEWAKAKAASWPPWRAFRLGMEESIDLPGRESRANKVVKSMMEGGYDISTWDRAARILAGWDTDGSPTIQTRAFPKRISSSLQVLDPTVYASRSSDKLWAARIQATRTLREAWASFCAYKETAFTDAHEKYAVYLAMFEKLFARIHTNQRNSTVVAGDGRERYDDPTSSRDRLYVPVEPPCPAELYASMLADDIKPEGRILCLLIDQADNFAEVAKYLKDSRLPPDIVNVFVGKQRFFDAELFSCLEQNPGRLFVSVLRALIYKPDEIRVEGRAYISGQSSSNQSLRLKRAIHLLRSSKTRYRPAYIIFFQHAVHQVKAAKLHYQKHMLLTQGWRTISTLQSLMQQNNVEPDWEMFVQLLALLEQRPRHTQSNVKSRDLQSAKDFFETCSMGRVSAGDWLSEAADSTLLQPPGPIIIRRLVCLLATYRDFEGVLSLLRWMRHFDASLHNVRTELANSDYLMEAAITQIRICFEGHRAAGLTVVASKAPPATAEQIEQAKSIIEDVESWPKWPSDENVADYLMRAAPIKASWKVHMDQSPGRKQSDEATRQTQASTHLCQ